MEWGDGHVDTACNGWFNLIWLAGVSPLFDWPKQDKVPLYYYRVALPYAVGSVNCRNKSIIGDDINGQRLKTGFSATRIAYSVSNL